MRLRTTAAALAGALALVLPAGAQAFADDGKVLDYVYVDPQNAEKNAQVKDVGADQCHALPSASSQVLEVVNRTDSTALMFEDAACEGEPVATLQPGDKAGDFHAAAVVFRQMRDEQQTDKQEKPQASQEQMPREQMPQEQAPEMQGDSDSFDDFR
ncbi:single stranded DNA-binding domain-containing protein [Streptomyces roseus]|uniref:Uncharacterized protein n=1 Tax=Streptomyces roseus TaxID=66430 RepID=A0A0J6XH34_9ACTN|nr:hypothetical protein [Streptomyces roseus]KMO93958.1 hypothetical protein ACS04_31875 [Streptomyces roseus]